MKSYIQRLNSGVFADPTSAPALVLAELNEVQHMGHLCPSLTACTRNHSGAVQCDHTLTSAHVYIQRTHKHTDTHTHTHTHTHISKML